MESKHKQVSSGGFSNVGVETDSRHMRSCSRLFHVRRLDMLCMCWTDVCTSAQLLVLCHSLISTLKRVASVYHSKQWQKSSVSLAGVLHHGSCGLHDWGRQLLPDVSELREVFTSSPQQTVKLCRFTTKTVWHQTRNEHTLDELMNLQSCALLIVKLFTE